MKTRASFAIFVYIVAANVPFWIASQSLGLLSKGPFNIEFMVIGILAVFLRRSLTVGLLLVAILLDMLCGLSLTYMLSASELLRSARWLLEFAPSHLWDIVVVIICIVMVCLMAILAADNRADDRERGYIAWTLAFFVIVGVVVDVSTGHVQIFRPDRQLGSIHFSRSPVRSLMTVEIQHQSFKSLASAGTDASVVAASRMIVGFNPSSQSLRTNAQLPNLVLILVESWGKPLATDMDESLLRPYLDNNLPEKYTLSRGTVPFYGPTVDGEARELCGSAIGFGLLTASASQLKSCLPTKLDMMGYHSMGVHGFSSRMFDRGEWYSRIGFDETWFRDRLQRQGLPLCPGPFPGICDAAASVWIGDQLQRESDSPQFIYWVTLNSHLPVPVPNLVKAPPSCSVTSITAENPAICSWYQLVFNVHRSVSELALRSTTRPTVFLIVGDHTPPFASPKLRSQFSDQVVPYVLLMPKMNGIKEGLQATRSLAVATHPPAETRKPPLKKSKVPSHFPVVS